MDVLLGGRRPVRPPAVGDHPRARLDVVGEERTQLLGRGIEERRHAAAAESLGLGALDGDAHLSPSTTHSYERDVKKCISAIASWTRRPGRKP